jgi:L-ribulokinase
MNPTCSLGLDFGTNSARALIVDTRTGETLASAVSPYTHGDAGVIGDPLDPNLARQHPADILDALETAVRLALAHTASRSDGARARIVGIGVDATASTPLPLDAAGKPLVFDAAFADQPAAHAWLWKDHTAHAEADEINALARDIRPDYLRICGGAYSSEWFWAKALRAARTAPRVFETTATWVELSDWIPALLCGIDHPATLARNVCAAGHKGLFHPAWGGYPDAEFLARLHPELARIRRTLPRRTGTIADRAGTLSPEWADRLGLPAGIPVAVGSIDAHMGAVGAGIAPGVLVKIIGTSSCDILLAPMSNDLPTMEGMCGVVPHSVLPGYDGIEAGQSAVGDIFTWFCERLQPGGPEAGSHDQLARAAAHLAPGQSGLLALDWQNGNRTILADPRLSGLLLGLHLHTTPAEIYRALVEATAFGARIIAERMVACGAALDRVVACGGIAVRSPMVMGIYADVLGRPVEVAGSDQTCALGAALAGAVVAGSAAGGHDTFPQATAAMVPPPPARYLPDPTRQSVYNRLFRHYQRLHDAFGRPGHNAALADVMKDLLDLRDATRPPG